jgi:hypothetical protein
MLLNVYADEAQKNTNYEHRSWRQRSTGRGEGRGGEREAQMLVSGVKFSGRVAGFAVESLGEVMVSPF